MEDFMDIDMPNEGFFRILDLPEELILYTLSIFSDEELCPISRACTYFYKLCSVNSLRKTICLRKHSFESEVKIDWKGYSIQHNLLSQDKVLLIWKHAPWHGSSSNENSDAFEYGLPTPRMAHTAVRIGPHKIAFIGGQLSPTIRYADVYLLNTKTMIFSKPVIRGEKTPCFARHTSTVVNGKVISFGGFDGFNTLYGLNILDIETLTWCSMKPSGSEPIPRTNHACTSIGDFVYIHGGNVTMNDEYTVMNDFHVLDTKTMTWSTPKTAGDIPSKRSAHKMVTVGNKIYLFGGGVWTPTPSPRWIHKYNDIYLFTPETNRWEKLHPTGNVTVCTFTMPFVIRNYIFIFGGQSTINDFCTNSLFCFDTIQCRWHEIKTGGDKPGLRDVGTACVSEDGVIFWGGASGGPINDLNILSSSSQFFPIM